MHEACLTPQVVSKNKKKKNLPGLGYARIMQVVCILVIAEREIGCMRIHLLTKVSCRCKFGMEGRLGRKTGDEWESRRWPELTGVFKTTSKEQQKVLEIFEDLGGLCICPCTQKGALCAFVYVAEVAIA